MKAVLFIVGVLYVAVLGQWLMGRLGRFLDGGGISPCWDEAEAAPKTASADAAAASGKDCCSKSDSNI